MCAVEAAEEEGNVVFVLEDGTKHRSPSAAASRVMGGKAVNGCPCGTRLHTETCTQSLSLPSCSACLSPSSPL